MQANWSKRAPTLRRVRKRCLRLVLLGKVLVSSKRMALSRPVVGRRSAAARTGRSKLRSLPSSIRSWSWSWSWSTCCRLTGPQSELLLAVSRPGAPHRVGLHRWWWEWGPWTWGIAFFVLTAPSPSPGTTCPCRSWRRSSTRQPTRARPPLAAASAVDSPFGPLGSWSWCHSPSNGTREAVARHRALNHRPLIAPRPNTSVGCAVGVQGQG